MEPVDELPPYSFQEVMFEPRVLLRIDDFILNAVSLNLECTVMISDSSSYLLVHIKNCAGLLYNLRAKTVLPV